MKTGNRNTPAFPPSPAFGGADGLVRWLADPITVRHVGGLAALQRFDAVYARTLRTTVLYRGTGVERLGPAADGAPPPLEVPWGDSNQAI